MLGMSIQVLEPGEANSMYHWETEQEDFVVLSGEALLIVEGQERPLRRWDFVHCPPRRGMCSSAPATGRASFSPRPPAVPGRGTWGYSTVDEAARRHDACSDEETQDGSVAYARVPPSEPARYRPVLLPGSSARLRGTIRAA